MLEALWSVEFGSNLNTIGAGIAVFETGRVLGGDSAFMYVGSYEVKNGTVTANLEITKYSTTGNMQSIFGPLSKFHLEVSGKVDEKKMTLTGHVKENPSLKNHNRCYPPCRATLTSRSSRSLCSLGHSALRTCSGLASPFSPEQALHAECRLTWRYAQDEERDRK